MSDPNWTQPQPGDPGTPRDVNREENIVWDGNRPEKYAGQSEVSQPKKAVKKAASTKSDSQE
jgi:hypothetical protein